DHPALIARAMALGAGGYLLKTVDRDSLVDAIQRLARGETLWTSSDGRKLVGAMSAARSQDQIEFPLTEREATVLRACAQGMTNKEIANQLRIRPDTVKEHVQHILRKLGVSDRTQAAIWAARRGLL
ncbi:MAG TPA: response regulator transcription factor, partial [Pirellulaceae bacterium]